VKSLCLVTGGAGFIGSHTVDLLLGKGYRVRILDSLQPRVHPKGKPAWVPVDAEFLRGDVTDRHDLGAALDGANFVLHLAAYQDYLPDFSTFLQTNAVSSALLFELIASDLKRYPVQKIVFASSQSVAGEGRYVCSECGGVEAPSIEQQLAKPSLAYTFPPGAIRTPRPRALEQLRDGSWELRCHLCGSALRPLLIDDDIASPGTAYAISKYSTELLANRLGRRCGIPTVCMRYTYVQGPRNSFYNAYSGIARRFALRLLQGLAPVIYEDGQQLRDYVNVLDVARANVLALEDSRADYQVFNVGGGRAVTILEFAHLMLREFASKLDPLIPGEFRLGDTRHTVSDISRLRGLGWEPIVPVETNVAHYVAWMREQQDASEYLEHAERVMRDQGVIQRIAGTV
jgi:dTDP-L-rhamnose 4-epimerase